MKTLICKNLYQNKGKCSKKVRKCCTKSGLWEGLTPETVEVEAENMCENSSTSTYYRSQEFNISRFSFRRILRKHLAMLLYKFLLIQELKPHDHLLRLRFTRWMVKWETARWIRFCQKKKHLAVFGDQKSQTCSYRTQCTYYKWVFRAAWSRRILVGIMLPY